MIQITDTIEFDESKDLEFQSSGFTIWFQTECLSKINFKNDESKTCSTFDKFGRPSTWIFGNITVEAEYYPIVGNQDFNFKKYLVYGNI